MLFVLFDDMSIEQILFDVLDEDFDMWCFFWKKGLYILS